METNDEWVTQALMDNYEERCSGFFDEIKECNEEDLDFDDEEMW